MKSHIIRSLPVLRDSRTVRYKDLINDSEVVLNTWEDSYPHKSVGIDRLKIGRKDMSKIVSYPLYLLYLFFYASFKVKKGDRVICMDLDTFIPVFMAASMKTKLIYLDVVDPIGQTKFSKFPFPKIFDLIEYFFLVKRRFTILPNDNRVTYYKDVLGVEEIETSYLLVENVPTGLSVNANANTIKKNNKIYDIGYFGTLDNSRGILELLNFAIKYDLKVLVAGMGALEKEITIIHESSNNVDFYGAYNSNELPDLYRMINFSWAFYTPTEFLHRYASPNKFYEHLAFQTPIITNDIVPMSSLVKENGSGIVISNVLSEINFEGLVGKINCFDFINANYNSWSDKYQDYKVDFLAYEKEING